MAAFGSCELLEVVCYTPFTSFVLAIIDPLIPGIRILEDYDCPADGVMFQNLWDSAIVGMDWVFRYATGGDAFAGSVDVDPVRISPGEVAVAVPHQMVVVDRMQEADRRLWSETERLPADYVESLLRAQQRGSARLERIQVDEEWHERTAARMRSAYEQMGVPKEVIPSVNELKRQLEESGLQSQQGLRLKRVPNEIRLSWVLFEEGLFYGPKNASVERLPLSRRQGIQRILPIPGHEAH